MTSEALYCKNIDKTHSLITEPDDKIQLHGNNYFKKKGGGGPLLKRGGDPVPPPPPLNPPLGGS